MLLFPQRLHRVLDEAKYESIISWQPHGRSFKVHKRDEFVKTVLPLFAKSGRTFASFMRQLNYYGFKQYDVPGPDKGSYYHPHFLRGCFDLCKDYMSRKQSVLDKKKKGPNNNLGGSILSASCLPKELNKGGAENLLISPLSTTANPVRISKPFHEARATRSQEWNSTPHGKHPKSFASSVDQHTGVSGHLYHPTTYSQIHTQRQGHFRLPKLEREYRNGIHLGQISRGRYPYQYPPNLYDRHHCPTWKSSDGNTYAYTSSNLQPRYQQGISKESFSKKDDDHCYKEERQDYEEQKKTRSEDHMISTQSQNHTAMMKVPPYLDNRNEKDIIFECTQHRYTTRNTSISQSTSSRSTMSPQFDNVSEGDSFQYDRRDESNFPNHLHATEDRLEKIQQQDDDFSSSNTPRASGSGGRQFRNSSSRQVSYDAVNDLIVGKDSDAHSSIEPVPDKDILQAFYNADNLKASTSEDLLQMSFSFP